ncbi:hypothetical protein BJ322DRAFT_1025600 [Thelephora terrestris]|uniref:Uncharacterized protein n=1 Tax=Thelephora terrestris TaxID=56493 RepID=A0A9P6L097_9AGAM|nr:hypothetical protein BJ322DRAFT_1025600 [Thelephora terrestris]
MLCGGIFCCIAYTWHILIEVPRPTNPGSTAIINKLHSASKEANVWTLERTCKCLDEIYPEEEQIGGQALDCVGLQQSSAPRRRVTGSCSFVLMSSEAWPTLGGKSSQWQISMFSGVTISCGDRFRRGRNQWRLRKGIVGIWRGPLTVLITLHGSGSPEDPSALTHGEGQSPAGPAHTGQCARCRKDKRGPYTHADRLAKGQLMPIESEASGSSGMSYQSVPRTDGFVPSSPLPTPIPPPEEHQSTLDPWLSDL